MVIGSFLTPKMADCLCGILMTQPERGALNGHKQSSSPEILDLPGKPLGFISWLVVSRLVVSDGFGKPFVWVYWGSTSCYFLSMSIQDVLVLPFWKRHLRKGITQTQRALNWTAASDTPTLQRTRTGISSVFRSIWEAWCHSLSIISYRKNGVHLQKLRQRQLIRKSACGVEGEYGSRPMWSSHRAKKKYCHHCLVKFRQSWTQYLRPHRRL